MKRYILAAAMLALTPAIAMAQAEKQDPGSLSNKAKETQATPGGSTAAPTAKPNSGSLPEKAAKDAPGTDGGSTGEPTAQPKSSDLPAKAKEDMQKK
jgi:hypothetical protein